MRAPDTKRLSKEELSSEDLSAFLKREGVPHEIIYHEETYSAEKASRVLNVDIKSIVKSVIFMSDTGVPVLVVVRGDKRVPQNRLAKELGFRKLRLANEEEVLRITGYRPGAVPPTGHRQKILTVVDMDLPDDEYVYCGGGSIGATLRIRVGDIVRLQDARRVKI